MTTITIELTEDQIAKIKELLPKLNNKRGPNINSLVQTNVAAVSEMLSDKKSGYAFRARDAEVFLRINQVEIGTTSLSNAFSVLISRGVIAKAEKRAHYVKV